MRAEYLILPAFALLVYACGGQPTETEAPVPMPDGTENAESAWEVLFDGSNLDSWHKYGNDDVGEAWEIQDGALYLNTTNKNDEGQVIGGGDIVTEESFNDYELELEWKIGACGNSGIIYNVTESDTIPYPWLTGPEMQILDNSCHPDAKIYKHRAGDLYDMIAGDSLAVRPAGEWNQIRLVVTDERVEHWMNGQLVVSYQPQGEAWNEMIAKSKFKDFALFGKTTSGQIALQDHGDPVWFRNIRIREL
jgi:hypothetical protein